MLPSPDIVNHALSTAIYALLTVAIPILGWSARNWLEANKDKAQAVIHANHLEAVMQVVDVGVQAAEQYMTTADGKSKKAWVINLAQNYMASKGIMLDLATLEALLEASVFQLPAASPAPAAKA